MGNGTMRNLCFVSYPLAYLQCALEKAMEFGCQRALRLGGVICFFHLSLHGSFANDGRFQARYYTKKMASHLFGYFAFTVIYLAAVAGSQEDVRNARITIIGVNKLTADILKFLQNKGAKMVFLANRSQIKAHYLADPLGIKVYTLDEKQEFLAQTDILISATSAPHLIIRKEDIPEQKRLLAIDLAFPRDIDSRLSELPNVQLYNIRDVEKKVRENIDVRGAEVEKAEAIIEEEIQEMQEALERRKKYIS